MEKTNNDEGLVEETSAVQANDNKGPDNQDNSLEQNPRPESGNIDYEWPGDFIVEEQVKPVHLSVESRLENLEKKQDQIALMLQQISSRIPKYPGYLTIKEASEKFEATELEIYQRMHWFRRVKKRPVEKKETSGKVIYREEYLVEVMLIDVKEEMRVRLQSLTD